jgi:hypothetical protein
LMRQGANRATVWLTLTTEKRLWDRWLGLAENGLSALE